MRAMRDGFKSVNIYKLVKFVIDGFFSMKGNFSVRRYPPEAFVIMAILYSGYKNKLKLHLFRCL